MKKKPHPALKALQKAVPQINKTYATEMAGKFAMETLQAALAPNSTPHKGTDVAVSAVGLVASLLAAANLPDPEPEAEQPKAKPKPKPAPRPVKYEPEEDEGEIIDVEYRVVEDKRGRR